MSTQLEKAKAELDATKAELKTARDDLEGGGARYGARGAQDSVEEAAHTGEGEREQEAQAAAEERAAAAEERAAAAEKALADERAAREASEAALVEEQMAREAAEAALVEAKAAAIKLEAAETALYEAGKRTREQAPSSSSGAVAGARRGAAAPEPVPVADENSGESMSGRHGRHSSGGRGLDDVTNLGDVTNAADITLAVGGGSPQKTSRFSYRKEKAVPATAPAVEAWVTVATAETEADSVEKGLQLVKPSKIKKGLQAGVQAVASGSIFRSKPKEAVSLAADVCQGETVNDAFAAWGLTKTSSFTAEPTPVARRTRGATRATGH